MLIIPSGFGPVSTDVDVLSLGPTSPIGGDNSCQSEYNAQETPSPKINKSSHVSQDLVVLGSRSVEDIDKAQTPQFFSKTKNIQLLHKLITSVQEFGDFCILDISSEGLCFTISDGNVCKVRLNLNNKIFSTYTFNGVWRNKREYTDAQLYANDTYSSDLDDKQNEDGNQTDGLTDGFDRDAIISIRLNLTSFLETINIHIKEKKVTDMSVECTFIYERENDPFVMTFEDDCIIEKCEMATFDIESHERKKKHKRGRSSNTLEETDEANIFNIESTLTDDSIFRLDSKKILFDVIIKSHILHDTIKDMNDLKTDKFILYCKQTGNYNENSNAYSKESKNPQLIFISKSKSDTIGFSKLIIPKKRLLIPEFKLFKPVPSANDPNKYDLLDCLDLSLSSTYHFDYFSHLLKAIKLSRLIKIRKDMNGITSLLLLLGKGNATNQEPDTIELYGSSIEFITLESLSINELSALNTENNDGSLLLKLGYDNPFVKQLIKDDHDIQTIRVGNDGKFVTLDDFFGNIGNIGAEFEKIENPIHNQNNFDNITGNNSFVPIEEISTPRTNAIPLSESKINKTSNSNILKLTEQLTMSLLGHAAPISDKGDNIQIEKTVIEEEDDDDGYSTVSKKRKRQRTTNNINKRSKNNKFTRKGKKNDNDKKKNVGIETVGGAIEIPLFI